MLLDFILESFDARLALLKFIELRRLDDFKLDELIEFYERSGEETRENIRSFIPLDFSLIKEMKQKYEKEELEQMIDGELGNVKEEHEGTKQETNQIKEKLERTKSEMKQAEIEYCTLTNVRERFVQSVNVGGALIITISFGEKTNNIARNSSPSIIHPPQVSHRSFLSSVSYQHFGCCHARWFTSWSWRQPRWANQCHSSENGNDRRLVAVSAVCSGYCTLYMFNKGSGYGRQLVLCDFALNGGEPVFS